MGEAYEISDSEFGELIALRDAALDSSTIQSQVRKPLGIFAVGSITSQWSIGNDQLTELEYWPPFYKDFDLHTFNTILGITTKNPIISRKDIHTTYFMNLERRSIFIANSVLNYEFYDRDLRNAYKIRGHRGGVRTKLPTEQQIFDLKLELERGASGLFSLEDPPESSS